MLKVVVILAVLFLAGCVVKAKKSISKDSVITEAIDQGAFLVDVRTPQEFAGGSVKGAVNIPLSTVKNELNKFKGKEPIVVFCRSGNRSGQAKKILEANGFKEVFNGGSWQNTQRIIDKK